MTEKRFQVTQTTLGSGIYDFQAENELCESYDEDAYGEVCKKLNELHEENKELKEVITEVFEMITNLDYVRKQYLNALLNILGEENDVDKTKKRIKEFLE